MKTYVILLSALLTLPTVAFGQTALDTPQRLVHQASGLCFTPDARGRGRSADVELFPCDDGTDQQWTISRNGEIRNVLTGECLEPGNRRQRGAVGLGRCGQPDQAWQLVGRGAFFSVRNEHSRLCLDVGGKRGDRPVMRACDRDIEQQWAWLALPPPARTMSLVNLGLCLDAQATPGRRTPDVARLVSCTGYPDQGWELTDRGELFNNVTGQCLTSGKKNRDGTRALEVADCRGTDKQRWKVSQRGVAFMLRNKDDDDLCLLGNGRGNEVVLGKCRRAGDEASWQWVSLGSASRPAPTRPVPSPPRPPTPPLPPPAPLPPSPPVVVVTPAPHPPARPPRQRGPQAMPEEMFAKVLDGMRRSTFSKDKLQAFEIGIDGHFVTCSQLVQAVGQMTMSSDKVKIVEYAAPNVLDKENREDVVRTFTFSSDQRKVRELLR